MLLTMPRELSSPVLSFTRPSLFAAGFFRTNRSRKITPAYRHLRGAFKPCFHSLL